MRSLCLLLAVPSVAFAVPLELPYQGRVVDGVGAPLNGSPSLDVTLYGSEGGSDVIHTESFGVDVDDGYFSVVLGAQDGNLLTASDLASDEVWVGLTVDSVDMGERTPLRSVPYAVRSQTTDALPDTSDCNHGDLLRFDSVTGRFACQPSTSVGNVVNVTTHVSNTPQAMGNFNSRVLETIPITKVSATSYLLVQGTLSGRGSYSGDLQQGWRYGSAPEVLAQAVDYSASGHSKIYTTTARIDTALTGTHDLVFRYYDSVGNGGEAPFSWYNPNSVSSTNDGGQDRLGQTQSVYVVWEIEP